MQPGVRPDLETARLSEIRSLDMAALRPKIERLTRLARTVAGAPISYVALVEADHVWNSGFPGHAEGLLDREHSTAAHIIGQNETLWVEDAQATSPGHPWVVGPPYVRFYCGAPIRLASGVTIGAFSVSGPDPRPYDAELAARIEDLAALLSDEIERLRAQRSLAGSLEAVESSEQRLRLAAEIADLLVYEVDFRNEVLKVDGAADTFFTKTMTFADVADVWSTIHPDDLPAALALWKRHLREGVPYRTEYRMRRDDGREVWAFAACELIRDEEGVPERLVGVLKNITDRRLSEVAVVAARDTAENANRAKSEFLANMSHEIRTPLNGVMGVAAALARTGLSPAQQEMVELIGASGRTLEAILSDVLDFSRIESGRLELKPEAFDLEACLRSAGALFEAGATSKGLDFRLDLAPEARGGFEGDAIRIRQIVTNLLSNAVKFTAEGEVELSARAAGEGETATLVIAVRDTGIGFDADFHARVFDRFEQADGSITRRFGGSGLGLAISRSLAEAMGGRLEAASTPGEGSTFTLTVALKRAAAPPAEAAAAPAPGALDLGRAPRVLLAEDHAVNRRVVELILGSAGVDLTCVENGAEAVEAASRGGFDLILMDMQMPVMDGLTAIREIRARERRGLPRTPIWGLSANALPEHIAASRAAGADGHLTKPISADALFAVLDEACARHEGDRASA